MGCFECCSWLCDICFASNLIFCCWCEVQPCVSDISLHCCGFLIQLGDVPPSCGQQNEHLTPGWISRPVLYSAIIISFWSSDEHTSNSKQYIIWRKDLKSGIWKMSWILKKSVVATYCCSAHFGHCRILLLEAEDSDVSLETRQSSPQLHLLDGSIQHVLGLPQYRKPRSM